MSERWRSVVGFEGRYEVSDLGRVRSVDRQQEFPDRWGGSQVRRFKGRVRALVEDKDGYPRVGLYQPGQKCKLVPVHRLVALAFVPNPKGLPHVDHLDSNRANATASNLAWVTNAENTSRSTSRGRMKRGHEVNTARLTAEQVLAIRARAAQGVRFTWLAAEFGVSDVNIACIVKRRTWRHV